MPDAEPGSGPTTGGAPDAAPDAPQPPATPADAPAEPAAPRIEISTALGPQSGAGTPAGAIGVVRAAIVGRLVPLLSLDAPSPFAPRSLTGALRDAPGARAVQVAVRRGGQRHGCGWLTAGSGRFTVARRDRCASPRWMPASLRSVAGGWRWRAALGAPLARGSYRFLVRVLDARGAPIAFEQS